CFRVQSSAFIGGFPTHRASPGRPRKREPGPARFATGFARKWKPGAKVSAESQRIELDPRFCCNTRQHTSTALLRDPLFYDPITFGDKPGVQPPRLEDFSLRPP